MVSACTMFIVCLFLLSSVQRALLSSPQVAAVIAAVLVDLANQDRAENSLHGLKVNPLLVAAAQAKADDMASKGYFAHTSPNGVDPWYWFRNAGYSFSYAGENLAVDFVDSGDVNTAWMNSPLHRKNILDPHYTEIGIATAQGYYKGRLTTFVVQEFGTPSKTVAQAPIQEETIPIEPEKVAVATVEEKPEPTQVLGSSAASSGVSAGTSESAGNLQIPLWGYIVGFPKDTMRYAYYVTALLIILALSYTTRFEMKKHHLRHAGSAAFLFALMGVLFLTAQYYIFTAPVVTALSL